MGASFNADDSAVNFYDAQSKGSEEYFLYIIQDGEHAGSGTSCYFWFSSPTQLLNSIKAHMDFWDWQDGWDSAADDLAKIIDSDPQPTHLSGALESKLDAYMYENAGIHLWAWGTFADLCASGRPFCAEVRKDFREALASANWEDGSESEEQDMSKPIAIIEIDDFVEFLNDTPT